MLEKNFKSELGDEVRDHLGRFWRAAGWAFVSTVTFAVLSPVGLVAQTASPGGMSPAQAGGFGIGAQTPLQFAGEARPTNQVSLSLGATAFYDDNVLGTNAHRLER